MSTITGFGHSMLPRRDALGLMGIGLVAAGLPWSRASAAPGGPMLGTPDQIEAERFILHFLKDPDLHQVQAQLKTELSKSTIGQTPAGAATLDRAIGQWTNSLLFTELFKHRRHPVFLWGTDNTPRTWLGHTLPGVGTSGDNPDAIYRTAMMDGSKRYEMLGWIDRTNPASQLVIQFDRSDPTNPASMMDMRKRAPDIASVTLKLLTDRDLTLGPDGSFRLTVGGEGDGPSHIPLQPGFITLGIRDLLADWRQKPSRLLIREIGSTRDGSVAEPLDYAVLKQNALADLPGYTRFWAKFPELWFGGLKPNTVAQPAGRHGGWGFVTGLRFDLQPDEAFILHTGTGNAAYTGFEINDPWMIMPDARMHQTSLNKSQVSPSADGTVTYVISQADPGLANWIDTVGVNAGMCVIRWQALPPGATADGLVRDFRVVKLDELAKMTDLPRVTPEQRKQAVAARPAAYEARLRVQA